MKKALIFQGKLVEVSPIDFPVSPEMTWVDVADDVTPETHHYNGVAVTVKPPPPPPTAAQIIATLTDAVQRHLDTAARARNYDSILSLCSYAGSAHTKFGPEGRAGATWRDAVWAKCYSVLADVQAGLRTAPTADGLIAELPALVWPA